MEQELWLLNDVNRGLTNPLLDLFMIGMLTGALAGITIGAACYGLFFSGATGAQRWRWLLWPQIGVVVIVSSMAYLDLLPTSLLHWPYSDKVLHFVLFGAIAFWLNLWVEGRRIGNLRLLPVAIVVPISVAVLEEGVQSLSPFRSADGADLVSNLLGMLIFWWLSEQLLTYWRSKGNLQLIESNQSVDL